MSWDGQFLQSKNHHYIKIYNRQNIALATTSLQVLLFFLFLCFMQNNANCDSTIELAKVIAKAIVNFCPDQTLKGNLCIIESNICFISRDVGHADSPHSYVFNNGQIFQNIDVVVGPSLFSHNIWYYKLIKFKLEFTNGPNYHYKYFVYYRHNANDPVISRLIWAICFE